MQRISNFVTFFVLSGLLLSCSTNSSENQLETLATVNAQDLLRLKDGKLLYPPPGDHVKNCPVNEENLPGQGVRLMGTVGGLTFQPTNTSVSATNMGSDLEKSFFSTTRPVRHTAILVVDNFNGGTYSLGSDVYQLPIWNGVKLKEMSDSVLYDLKQRGHYSHGALVKKHIEDVIEGTGKYFKPQTQAYNDITIWQRNEGDEMLAVIAVEANFDQAPLSGSAPIADAIRASLARLKSGISTPLGIVSFKDAAAINMSFGMLPCEVVDDFTWAKAKMGLGSFQDYLQKLAGIQKKYTPYDALVTAVIESANLPHDPLLNLIQNDPNDSAQKHVYVGSSGNYGFALELYPAAWKDVISVSGSLADDPNTSTIDESLSRDKVLFNQADVMHVGAWFELGNIYYGGTSFSAPIVSAFTGLDLGSNRRCASGQGVSKLASINPSDSDIALEDKVDALGQLVKGAVSIACP